jgi:hypothetical protein
MTNATPTRQSTAVRSLLWVLLTITAVANATTSAMGMNPVISISFGLVTLAAGVGLVANYRRNR